MARTKRIYGGNIRLTVLPMLGLFFVVVLFLNLVTAREDIFSVFPTVPWGARQSPDESRSQRMEIDVFPEGFRIAGQEVSDEALAEQLLLHAENAANPFVLIRCRDNSQHGSLIYLLDLCYRHKLTDLFVCTI